MLYKAFSPQPQSHYEKLGLLLSTCLLLHIKISLHFTWKCDFAAIQHLSAINVEYILYFKYLFCFVQFSTRLFFIAHIFSILLQNKNQHLHFEYHNTLILRSLQSKEISFFRWKYWNILNYTSKRCNAGTIGYHYDRLSFRDVERRWYRFHPNILWFSSKIFTCESIGNKWNNEVNIFFFRLPRC